MTAPVDRRSFLINSLKASAVAVFGANPGWGARVDPAPASIKITRVKLYVVNVPERKWWWSDDFYGQPAHQRVDNHVAEIETDQGLTTKTAGTHGYPGIGTRSLPSRLRSAIKEMTVAAADIPSVSPM